jgi:hypothetical protein
MTIEVPKSVKSYSELAIIRNDIKCKMIGSFSGHLKSILWGGLLDNNDFSKKQTEKFLEEMEQIWDAQYEIKVEKKIFNR